MGETREIKSTSKNNKEGKGKNKLIFFLSKYKFDPKECHYKSKYDGGNNEIYGKQTPDAPTKYFLNYLTEKGKKIDDILCITSKDTNERKKNRNKPDKEYESAFENYQRVLNEFCEKKKIEVPKLIKLNFDYNFEKGESIDEDDRYRNLFKSIVDEISENDTVYIDYTSGIRDTSLLIILMIRYLEYTGIKCGGMIYSYFDNDDKEKNKIIDIKSTYDLFELLNGVNEFTSFGKSKTLSNYYNNIWKDKEEYKEISELIETMNDFSDMMSLCMVEDIDEIMKKLNQKIIEAEKIKNKINSNENQLMNYMFFNLIKEIKKKFYLEDGERITYINLIKWCLDNDLTQQALTLYVEKMPEYYRQCKYKFFNEKDEIFLKIIDKYENCLGGFFYTGIFEDIKNYDKYNFQDDKTSQDQQKIQKLKNIIKLNRINILSRDKRYIKRYEEEIQQAIKEIYNIMDEKYKEKKVNIKVNTYKNLNDFNENIPVSEDKFINWLEQQNELLSYLLNIPYEKNKQKNKNKSKSSRDKTYDKKIESLKLLKEKRIKPSWSNIDSEDLLRLMEDYLYFKIMRNQINHAKKSDLSVEVKEYFKEINYNMTISAKDIKNIMKKSVENIEQIELILKINEEKEIATTI